MCSNNFQECGSWEDIDLKAFEQMWKHSFFQRTFIYVFFPWVCGVPCCHHCLLAFYLLPLPSTETLEFKNSSSNQMVFYRQLFTCIRVGICSNVNAKGIFCRKCHIIPQIQLKKKVILRCRRSLDFLKNWSSVPCHIKTVYSKIL